MMIPMVYKYLFLAVLCISAPAHAYTIQKVSLQIRPRMGDTLKLKMDQKVEVVGTARNGGDTVMAKTSTMQLLTRAIPLSFNGTETIVIAIADSVSVTPHNTTSKAQGMQGQSIQLKLATDGSVRLVDDQNKKTIAVLFANMPATLPGKPVAVGESWTREMTVPSPYNPKQMRNIKAVFQLDSLRDNGDMAYISMRGTITHVSNDDDLSGSIMSSMQVDRRMAWMTSSRTTIKIASTVIRDNKALDLRVKITQLLRAQ